MGLLGKRSASGKVQKEVTIFNKLGLHARPAAMFVRAANKHRAEIWVEKDGEQVNGKSIMGLMMLAAGQGTKLILSAEGADAEQFKIISGDFITPQTQILPVAAADAHRYDAVHRQAAEDGVAVAIIFVVGIGERGIFGLGGVGVEEDQLALSFDAERPENNSVDKRKNGGVGADTKSQRQNRSDGEAGTAAQTTEGDDQILE